VLRCCRVLESPSSATTPGTPAAAIAAVVVPFTLLQYLLGGQVQTRGGDRQRGGGGGDDDGGDLLVRGGDYWAGGAGWSGMSLGLTAAILRAVAAEVVGQEPGVEQSYRFGFYGSGRCCWNERRPSFGRPAAQAIPRSSRAATLLYEPA
jgi:hypothetical protein